MNPKDAVGCNKVQLQLVPGAAKVLMAKAMKYGANRYGVANWRDEKILAQQYIGATLRHIESWYDGEDNDADSGINHLGHALATLAILVDAMTNDGLIDDRPKPGRTAELIRENTVPPAVELEQCEVLMTVGGQFLDTTARQE